jgi:glutamate--cysteine ligase
MGLARNILRYGWIIPYLFGASASVCKSFMKDYHKHDFEEFDDNTFYLPYATSLRMSDIGYQNSQEDEKGVKANYNSLCHYVHSLRAAMQTNCEDFEKIGLKKDGEYQQLNTNILQIANEYYASVRPKPLLHGMNKPLRALTNNGIGYIEIRSLDVNPLISLGIDKPQIHFLEAFLLFCLLQDSATISTSEQFDIDNNDNLVSHKGRQPGLKLRNNGMDILLQDWGKEIFSGITECSTLLTKEHQNSVQKMLIRINNPDLTPSAIMLEEMQQKELGFFEYIDKFSHQNKELYRSKSIDKGYFVELEELAISSHQKQLKMEAEDILSFDKFIEEYFADDA